MPYILPGRLRAAAGVAVKDGVRLAEAIQRPGDLSRIGDEEIGALRDIAERHVSIGVHKTANFTLRIRASMLFKSAYQCSRQVSDHVIHDLENNAPGHSRGLAEEREFRLVCEVAIICGFGKGLSKISGVRICVVKEKEISVVVPCYNEAAVIYSNVKKLRAYLQDAFDAFEIIVVNDGSRDGTTKELARLKDEMGIRVINHPVNEGKGKSVKDGVLSSRYSVILFLDADLAIPIEELAGFLVQLHEGYDIIVASRFVSGATLVSPVLWYRRILEIGFRWLRTIIVGDREVKDTQCGFKLFRREKGLSIFRMMTINRFAFDSEIIYLAKKLGCKVKEMPVALQNPQTSSVRLTFDPANMLVDLIRIRINDFRKRYEASGLSIDTYRNRLIISADDFGISNLANENIFYLIQQGKIDRVGVMVDQGISQTDVDKLLASGVKLDVHLDRRDGSSPKRKLKAGAIGRGFLFLLDQFNGEARVLEMQQRWGRQIETFRLLFRKLPDGVNTHEHVHFFPPYLRAVLSLCRQYGIPYIRFGKKALLPARNNVFRILQMLQKRGQGAFQSSSCDSSDYLVSLDWIPEIGRFLCNLPEGRTEVVCHPERSEEFETIARFF